MNLISGDKSQGFGERDANDLDLLVDLRLCDTNFDIPSQIDMHVLAEKAGAGEIFSEEGPAFGTVAGLFNHFAFGGGERGFTGLNATGGEFEKKLAGGVAVLTLQDD